MTTQLEEVVVNTDALDAEKLLPDAGHRFFDGAPRRYVRGRELGSVAGRGGRRVAAGDRLAQGVDAQPAAGALRQISGGDDHPLLRSLRPQADHTAEGLHALGRRHHQLRGFG